MIILIRQITNIKERSITKFGRDYDVVLANLFVDKSCVSLIRKNVERCTLKGLFGLN